jgi:hypothetical protein
MGAALTTRGNRAPGGSVDRLFLFVGDPLGFLEDLHSNDPEVDSTGSVIFSVPRY